MNQCINLVSVIIECQVVFTYWFSIHTFSCPLMTTFNSYLYCGTTLKTCLLNAWLEMERIEYKCKHYYDYCNCIISIYLSKTP